MRATLLYLLQRRLCPAVFITIVAQASLFSEVAFQTVSAGQSITLSSDTAVTWTLCFSCVGSLSTTGPSTSTIYTAPPLAASHTALGCQISPSDDIFDTRIDNLPLNVNNDNWMAASSTAPLTIITSWGFSYADGHTPTQTRKMFYRNGLSFTYPTPIDSQNKGVALRRESGKLNGYHGYASNPDHHTVIVNVSTCSIYEIYDDALNGYTENCQDGSPGCNLRSGIAYTSTNYYQPQFQTPSGSSTEAAGGELSPLTATLGEIKSGVIRHALRFTTNIGSIYGNPNTGVPAPLWPESSSNGCSTCVNAPPMGARFRLKKSLDLSGFSWFAQVILTALKTYGGVLVDIGGGNQVTVGEDLSADSLVEASLQEINLPFSASFEWVDESMLQHSASGYEVCPLGTQCAFSPLPNIYVSPNNQAFVSSGEKTIVIGIEGVAIGTSLGPNIVLQAGNYSWQVPFWVTPSSVKQGVTWTVSSGVGTITPNGSYRPPLSQTGAANAVLHGVADANPAATLDLFLTIIPQGTVGINYTNFGQYSDTVINGTPWISTNMQPDGGDGSYDDTYPSPGWTNGGDLVTQFSRGRYSRGGDLTQEFVVPNGNYDVTLLTGLNNMCGGLCTSILGFEGLDSYNYGFWQVETNGQTVAHHYDIQPGLHYAPRTASPLFTVPATVTNNLLYLALRSYSQDITPYYAPGGTNSTKYTVLSGIQLARNAGPAHWTIDTQQQDTIGGNQTLLPFYVVDWFTGVNDPIWSVVSGPPGSSITSDGILSLNSVVPASGQPIVVKASDGVYSALATISTPASSLPKPSVNWSAPTPIDYGTRIGPAQLNAMSDVPGNLVYTPQAGTILPAGNQELSVTFVPKDSSSYASVFISVPLLVNRAVPVVTWPSPSPIAYGSPLTASRLGQLNAAASVSGNFSYSPGIGAILPVGPNVLTVTFYPTDSSDYTPTTAYTSIQVFDRTKGDTSILDKER